MAVQRLEPDDNGNLVLVDTLSQDSDGTAYASVVEPLPGGALPGIDPVDESARQHATLDALQADLALAMGATGAANATAGQIVAGLETRIDRDLGISP